MDTLERLDILGQFKRGEFDALVGINLLREGLDIPEVSLVAILNADNEGFLRSETTLMQISGRAARNKCGEVLLFADRRTGSMGRALDEMDRRRAMQLEYNEKHGIKPESVARRELAGLELYEGDRGRGYELVRDIAASAVTPENLGEIRLQLEREMKDAADQLNFELAAKLRDRLFELADMSGPGKAGKPRKAGRGRSRK
jgi:excinuclease ABC subunit B